LAHKKTISETRTVTGYDQELIIVTELMDCHIRISGNDLLFGCQLRALLEFKVADGSRQGQVPVHTAEIDKATRGANASLLAYRNY
jgi:hypothetical protein